MSLIPWRELGLTPRTGHDGRGPLRRWFPFLGRENLGSDLRDAGDGAQTEWPPVLVADRHELFATALRMALRSRGVRAYELPVNDARTMVAAAAAYPVGLVFLDLALCAQALPDRSAAEPLVRALRGQGKKVLVTAGADDERAVAAAVAAGALAVLSERDSFEDLLDIVGRASAGLPVLTEAERQHWLDRHRHHRLTRQTLVRRFDRLSPREWLVLDRLAQGQRAAAVAAHEMVSLTTVRTQIRSILTKLEVNSQLEAVALFASTSAANGPGENAGHVGGLLGSGGHSGMKAAVELPAFS